MMLGQLDIQVGKKLIILTHTSCHIHTHTHTQNQFYVDCRSKCAGLTNKDNTEEYVCDLDRWWFLKQSTKSTNYKEKDQLMGLK